MRYLQSPEVDVTLRVMRVVTWSITTTFLLAAPLAADVVTKRLGTGLPPSGTAGVLPQTWVTPVNQAPRVDGKLDEDLWSAARPIVLGKLSSRGKTTPRTEARLVHHGRVLYVGMKLDEPNVQKLKRNVTEDDGPLYQDDSVELFISPYPSQGYFQFIIGASGAIFDRKGYGDPKAFDAGATAAVEVGQTGWTLEVAIPMEPMGVGDEVPTRWRANIYRNRQAGSEGNLQAWSATLSEHYDRPDYFGHWLFTPESPWKKGGTAHGEPMGITVHQTGRGEAVLAFDLTGAVKDAKVYRARLLCDRSGAGILPAWQAGSLPHFLDEIEIVALAAPFEEGATVQTSGAPLKLAGPQYRSFDLTDLVRDWVGGRGVPGVFVKKFPGWRPEKTYLEVMWEGEPNGVPPQVDGVQVFHREGQTFVTFKEVGQASSLPGRQDACPTWGEIKNARANAPDALSYRIYRHGRPITSQTIVNAELVAEVGALSGYNTNGRNKEYLIGQAMVESDEIGELARDWGGYMHTWTMDHPRMDRYPVPRLVIDERRGPLPVGTGLYVHQAEKAGRTYYAVVSCRRGVENLRNLSGRNTTGAVDEKVGVGVPVRQGKGLWGPYFDYPGTRWVYVQWAGPPLAPRQSMYFNWSVLIPAHVGQASSLPGRQDACPTELYFHGDGYSYAQPGKKLLRASIQLAPHDYPASGWYGFNEAWTTLRSPKVGQASSLPGRQDACPTVSNHTQKRIVAFLDWAKQELPIDPDRILAVGSDGAAAMAANYPEMFAYVVITRFDRHGVLNPESAAKFAAAWGPKSPEVKDTEGRGNWAWADLDKLVEKATAEGRDLPLFACRGPSWGRVEGWGKGRGRFYRAMHQAGQPLMAHWAWGGRLEDVQPDKWSGLWHGLDVSRSTAIPAFSNCSLDKEGEGGGNTNLNFSWTGVKDDPNRFEMTITCRECTFDMTLRRLQRFKVGPRGRVRWEATAIPDSRGETADPQTGETAADEHGVVTIRGLKYPARVSGLVVSGAGILPARQTGSLPHFGKNTP